MQLQDDYTYGPNMYEDCEMCGSCCTIGLIAMTTDEAQRILDYVRDNDIKPVDHGAGHCPLVSEEGHCLVFPVRSQTCRLYNCKVPREQILEANPDLEILPDKLLVDMHRVFFTGDLAISDEEDFTPEG